MTWHTGRLALFDLETTGVDPHRDRIVSAAVILVGAGHDTVTSEWLVNPGIDIPEGAAAVHGITTEHAQQHGTDPSRAVHEIGMALYEACSKGIPVVGHNVVYDLTMLHAESIRHSSPVGVAELAPVIDTMVIEKHLDPFRPGKPNGRRPDTACGPHTLIECCRLWGIDLTEADAHGAAADALAAGRLAWRLATQPDRFAEFDGPRGVDRINPGQWPLDRLHAWQAETKKAQADSFGKYLVKQGKPDDVSREWPVQSPPPGWTPEQLPTPREADAA